MYVFFLQNDSELFGRTVRVNLARPLKVRDFTSRPVWAEDTWLAKHAGETLGVDKDSKEEGEGEGGGEGGGEGKIIAAVEKVNNLNDNNK